MHPTFDTRIFRKECRSLARLGYEVKLIITADQEQEVDGVHIIPLSKAKTELDIRWKSPRKAVDIAMGIDADLYHFHDPELILPMRKLARHKNKPVVWDAHENYHYTIAYFNKFKCRPISRIMALAFSTVELNSCKKQFSGVVTINDLMAHRYRDHGIRTAAVGNFPEYDLLPYPPRVSRTSKPRFINAGTMWLETLPNIIAQAFALVRCELECEIAFWGRFKPPITPDSLRSIALSKGGPDEDVIIGGPYSYSVLVEELIPTAWAGCVLFDTNDYNNRLGLPNRFFELWANGIPAIVSRHTNIARIVEEIGGGIVVDNTPDSIAEAFHCLAKDPGIAVKMGKAGRAAIESRYNWKSAFQELLDLYNDIGVHVSKVLNPDQDLKTSNVK